TGKAEKPVSNYLSDVLNFVDRADIRHVHIIMNACGDRCEAHLSATAGRSRQSDHARYFMNESNILLELQALDKKHTEARENCERLFYGSGYEAMARRRNEFNKMFSDAFDCANQYVCVFMFENPDRIHMNINRMTRTIQNIAAWNELYMELLTSKGHENELMELSPELEAKGGES
ncbi:MAG: hypothetical protein LBL24_11085, partial [Bacteroidales bacterium]|nr:hypothetical protein [Bacteroidales bacterium]